MSGHTPGPWEVVDEVCIEADGAAVALVDTHELNPGALDADANATLIAAAPDLLAACRFAIDCLAPHMDMAHDMLEEAITKATGATP